MKGDTKPSALEEAQHHSLLALVEKRGELMLNSWGYKELRWCGLSRADVKAAVDFLAEEGAIQLTVGAAGVVVVQVVKE